MLHHKSLSKLTFQIRLLFLLLFRHVILICQSDRGADKSEWTRALSKLELHLDVLHSLAEGDSLVGRLSSQLFHHLPLLLNTTRHPHFIDQALEFVYRKNPAFDN